LEGDQVSCFVNDQRVLKRSLPEAANGQVGLAKFRDTQATFRQFEVAKELAPSQPSAARLDPVRQRLESLTDDDWRGDQLVAQLTSDATASRRALQERADALREQAERLTRLANDVHVRDTSQQLADRFTRPEAEIGLAEAALLVSRLDNPELDVAAYLAQLDRMVAEIQAGLHERADASQRLAALNRYLFQENGFHGSRTQYYQAANSYFDRLLDDREGLPITLGVLYLELAARLGLKAEGVGLPGHFVVRLLPPDGEAQLIDVFDAGKSLSLADARRLSFETSGVDLDDSYLVPLDKRAIVLRILRNLQGIAQRQQDPEALLRCLEAMVSLAPEEPSYRGMRAMVRHETGRKAAALADLDWFLDKAPQGIDLQAIRELKQRFSDEP
jgi:regulator of sirC expression with transglutaminase-like and TPR domain